jgi:hypothetical protein
VQVGRVPVEGPGIFGMALAVLKESLYIYASQAFCDKLTIHMQVAETNCCDCFCSFSRVKMSNVDSPFDLLAYDNALYLPDKAGKCLWKISAGEIKKTTKELNPECIACSHEPVALSMTSFNRILITTSGKQVLIYYRDSASDDQFEELCLPGKIEQNSPQHIIEHPTHPDRYLCLLACSSGDNDKRRLGRLLELKREDNELKLEREITIRNKKCRCSFGEDNHSSCYLNDPRHMARLSDNEILVADYRNDRVIVFNLDNESVEELLIAKRPGVYRPCRLAYYAEHRLLLVSMRQEGIIYCIDGS